MIQNIYPEVFYNQFRNDASAAAREDDTVFAFRGRTILSRTDEDGVLSFPSAGEAGGAGMLSQLQYLFSIRKDPEGQEHRFFLLTDYASDGEIITAKLPGYSFSEIRDLRTLRPKDLCFAGMTAYHLYVWYRDNVFCGRCGEKTHVSARERALVCPRCGNTIYPKICPAVIVGVTKGDKILMTRYAGRGGVGNALIAGFCEIGETAEETVQREVMEEVGLHVTDIRYYKTQPWGFESDLLLGYYCAAAEDEDIVMDESELSRAVFVPRNEIGQEDNDVSLTAEMIQYFRDHPEKF